MSFKTSESVKIKKGWLSMMFIVLKRPFQVCRPISLWVSRMSEIFALKRVVAQASQRSLKRDNWIRLTFIKDLVAYEAINLLDHKTFGGNMAIKKAFDTMD
ncbi:hypothetical protein Lal_00005907 [Lupinus albus]|nr:hypothetical protein Lal_00005907 [Lupinus albus]